MKTLIFAGAAAAALLCASPAQAAIAVTGNGPARSCYVMALHDRDDAQALHACDVALNTQALSATTRAETLVNRGIIYLNRRDFSLALADFDHAQRLKPGLAEAYTHRGVALIGMGDYRGAVEAITHGISLQPQEPAKAYFNRAVAYEELGDVRNAYNDYRRAADLAPDWVAAHTELARFQVRVS